MKKITKYLLLLLLPALFSGTLFTSCDDEKTAGDPIIHYVRVTNPAQSDSLLVKASMGSLIAIIGENLSGVVELWFNDQQAALSSTYITNTSILVNVPNLPPQDVTNKITLVLRDGSTYAYDFQVTVPAPVVNSIGCEYVAAGDIAVLKGDFFFDPEVIFSGDAAGEVVSFTQTEIRVAVPEGAESGPITVKTLFGSVKSAFHFRDTRGLFWNFDDLAGGGWHPGKLQSDEPAGVSGNYVIFKGSYSDWGWNDADFEADLWGQSAGRPQGPLWEGGTTDKALRFEANVVQDWAGGCMYFIFTPWSNANNSGHTDNSVAKGTWRPWVAEQDGLYKTDGWITVTIPLSEFVYNHGLDLNNLSLNYPDGCGSLSIFLWGSSPVSPTDIFICIDNVRVVDL
ncbi:MAG: glycan-binding surface protein [Mangrovibacterium sp.]